MSKRNAAVTSGETRRLIGMTISRSLLLSTFCGVAMLPGAAATWTPDPSLGNVAAHQRLYEIARAYCDAHFDPAVNLVHEKPRDHLVRESAYYAFTLLLTGDTADRAKAQPIIKKVLAAQDTRPNSVWRGAFVWRAEDTWATAKNPDLNSAAFVGTALAAIANLDRQHPCLDPDVRKAVDEAGGLAVGAVMRRNVDPGYTNISLLSTALAAAGAKLWSVPGADTFADGKLSAVLQLADDGAVYEYSSPTYSAVDLQGAYLAREFAFSDAFAKKADTMIDHLWKEIALAYHAPSFQLGGPYNRAYGNDMLTYAAGLKFDLYLALDGDYPLPEKLDTAHGWDQGGLAMIATLPVKARPEFQQPPPGERTWTAVGPDDGHHPTRELHQYRDGNFILGTVALQDEWKQKRNLVADWRTDVAAAPGYRIGFCIDETNETLPGGFPPATIHFNSQQKGGAALVALEAQRGLPPSGACSLVFDTDASVEDPKASPVVVRDGAITTYVFPVSDAPVTYETKTDTASDQHTFQLNRPWSTADAVGKVHVISYLVVFRPANAPAPKVSDLALTVQGEQVSATAKVDGTDFAVTVGK